MRDGGSGQLYPKLNTITACRYRPRRRHLGREGLRLFAQCTALLRPVVVWQLGGICAVILVAALFYYAYPAWKLRRRRLQPLSPSELPEVTHEFQSLAETAQLPKPPILVWNPLATALPVVFGRHGRYYVALSGSFVTQHFYRDRDSFRAIMLHEFAHIRNGDIPKTYLTLSLLLGFLATTLAPSLLLAFWNLATSPLAGGRLPADQRHALDRRRHSFRLGRPARPRVLRRCARLDLESSIPGRSRAEHTVRTRCKKLAPLLPIPSGSEGTPPNCRRPVQAAQAELCRCFRNWHCRLVRCRHRIGIATAFLAR